jgi:hypothetical protein
MNLPQKLQLEVEKWAHQQGISPEQFILQAVSEKLGVLNQQSPEPVVATSQLVRKGGVLVAESRLPADFDTAAFMEELRTERIREQLSL